MPTWRDVIASEKQKKRWIERYTMLQQLEQPFTIEQLANLWGISVKTVRCKLTALEKRHPFFIYRNKFMKNHLITFHWGEEIIPEPPKPTIEAEVEIPKVIEPEVPELPPFLKERTYTETINKLTDMNVITPRSKVTFEPLTWREQQQRGRLRVIVTTGRHKLIMTGLYDNGFPVSALIQVE